MIHVFGNYYVQLDGKQYIAVRKLEKSDKDGNPIYKFLGYYTKMSCALVCIKDKVFADKMGDRILELKTALLELKQINEDFKNILDVAGIE